MEVLIMTFQMVLGLSIIVGLHEFGHMINAKLFGMRVEQFSIGFPPKVFGFKYGETIYSIGAIPLGGYVKITGMIDESLDTKTMKEDPKPWEFRSKPAWQRLIVMFGGIIINVITGIVIFTFMASLYGEEYISKNEVNKYGIVAFDVAKDIGLQTGDKIIRINGHDYEKFNDLWDSKLLLENNAYYTVERDGELMDIPIPEDFVEVLIPEKGKDPVRFVDCISQFEVEEIQSGLGADKAGIKPGDKIISINGEQIEFLHEFQKELLKVKGTEAKFEILRNEQIFTNIIEVSDESKIGIYPRLLTEITLVKYSFWSAISKGTQQAFDIVFVSARSLGKIISGELSFKKSITGPIGIAEAFGGKWNWYRFWYINGLLSMVLAFMNFLPIPALDGGHIMFLSFELYQDESHRISS